MEGVEINSGFEQVLNFVNQTNRLIFLTGKAGTGKTTLLKYIRANCFKQLAIVAPTGVAAINAGGSTIHSFFQFPFGPFLINLKENGEPDAVKNSAVLKYTSQRLAIFRNLELLIVDEVSMVRADLLDQIDVTLRQTRKKWQQPFGGVQVLFIGDMYQLPPVVPSEEWQLLADTYPSPFFFESKVLRQHPPVFIELEKIYRQTNQVFIDLLNKVRTNTLNQNDIALLNSRYKATISDQEYNHNITLTTHNRKADEINNRHLNRLSGKAYTYQCKVDGQFSEKNYPADEVLALKKGARVMFLKNNSEKNYYNGKIGTIAELDEKSIKVVGDEDQLEIEVVPESWTNVSYKLDKTNGHLNEEILGTFTQYPLRLAWAITIHKSQGLTFNNLIIDAAESFSAGQVYVALSRCRSLEGLTLSSRIGADALISEKAVVHFSNSRQSSSEITNIFSGARQDYIKTVLMAVFDFSDLFQERTELGAGYTIFNGRFSQQGREWLEQVMEAIDRLKDVAGKFKNQLQQLMMGTSDVEVDEALQTRVQKASQYFGSELDKLLGLFKETLATTESKEAAEELTPVLQKIFEETYQKRRLIESCESGFQFLNFLKHKLALKLPAQKINIYASARNTKISNVPHPALFKRLLALRDEICEESHRPIYMVASNKTLEELVHLLPSTPEDLIQVKGFGPAKIAAFGDQILKLINEYKSENNLPASMNQVEGFVAAEAVKAKKSKKKNNNTSTEEKISSPQQTFALYQQGLSLEQIAQERKLTLGTISSHLLPFVAAGEITLERLVSADHQHQIEAVLDQLQEQTSLSAIKSALPDTISFADIRFVLAHKNSGRSL